MSETCYNYEIADISAGKINAPCLKNDIEDNGFSANILYIRVIDNEDIIICFDDPLSESGASPTEKNILDQMVADHVADDCPSESTEEEDYLAAANEPTGFLTYKEGSHISKDDGTRTLTIKPDDTVSPPYTEYIVFFIGVKRVYTEPQSTIWPDTEGIHFIYFDQETQELTTTQIFSIDILERHAYVAVLYWDKDNQKTIYFGCERHGTAMDGRSHSHFHQTLHTQWTGGLALENLMCCQDGSSDTHTQFSITDGRIRDEDLLIYISDGIHQELSPIANIKIFWREGTIGSRVWRARDGDNFPIIYDGDTSGYTATDSPGRPAYNPYIDSGSPIGSDLVELDEGKFFNMHYFATNDQDSPVIGIVGTQQYVSREDARTGANEEMVVFLAENGTGEFFEIPFAEFTPIATVLFEASSAYTNSVRVRVRRWPDGEAYIDWRGTGVNPASEASIGVHGALQNLEADDHTQYLTEERHDGLPYDNPHNVELSQLGDLNITSPSPSDGQVLTYNSSPGEWTAQDPSTMLTSADMASVQARRTTAFSITSTSFQDVTLDVTDTETEPTVIQHDDTNTDRIKIKDTALYRISWEADIYISGTRTVTGRVVINDTTQLTGSEGVFTDISGVADNWVNPCGRAVEKVLNANDYLTLQFKKDSTGGTHEARRCTVTVTRLTGAKGEKGDPGSGPNDGQALVSDTDDIKGYLSSKICGASGISVIIHDEDDFTDVSGNLVMQYFMNEAASGTGPTSLVDSSDSPGMDLTITRDGGEPFYIEESPGRGWEYTSINGDGRASAAVDGSKFKDRIHGVKKMTYEIVLDIHNSHSYNNRLIHSGTGSKNGRLTLAAQPTGGGSLQVHLNDDIVGYVDIDSHTKGRFVAHMVVDTTQTTSSERVKIYVDGVKQSWTSTTSLPSQDETIDLQTGHHFVVSNREIGGRNIDGEIYYVAVYDTALNQETITYHTTQLTNDDDTSPLQTGSSPASPAETNECLQIGLDGFVEESDDGEDSTTSSTHETKVSANFSEASGGKWRIAWYCEMSNTAGGDMQGEVIVNDTTKMAEWDFEQDESNDWTPISGFGYYSAAVGDHKVDLDYWESASATNKIRRARLELWRMG